MAEVGAGVSGAFLLNDVDRKRMRVNAKTMEAAVRGWSYRYREQYFEEGYGFQPAEEALENVFSADRLAIQFDRSVKDTLSLLDFVSPDTGADGHGAVAALSAAPAYRKNTAFIIMWIDRAFDDVVDAVRDVFQSFGIAALRADELEHEGAITSRVLEEITHSEFLFADLTGRRPNVY